MEAVPEVVITFGAGLVAFLVGAIKMGFALADRIAILVTLAVGVAVAALVYVAGFVEIEGLTTAQMIARALIAGFLMAATASGARSWTSSAGGGGA